MVLVSDREPWGWENEGAHFLLFLLKWGRGVGGACDTFLPRATESLLMALIRHKKKEKKMQLIQKGVKTFRTYFQKHCRSKFEQFSKHISPFFLQLYALLVFVSPDSVAIQFTKNKK